MFGQRLLGLKNKGYLVIHELCLLVSKRLLVSLYPHDGGPQYNGILCQHYVASSHLKEKNPSSQFCDIEVMFESRNYCPIQGDNCLAFPIFPSSYFKISFTHAVGQGFTSTQTLCVTPTHQCGFLSESRFWILLKSHSTLTWKTTHQNKALKQQGPFFYYNTFHLNPSPNIPIIAHRLYNRQITARCRSHFKRFWKCK